MDRLAETFILPRSNAPALVRRIAVVTETWPPEVNGVAMTTERMVQGLAQRHRIEVVRVRQSRDDVAPQQAAYESLLLPGAGLPRYNGLHIGLPATGKLVRHWQQQRPDLVHVVTEGPLGWSAVRAAQRLGIPLTSDFHTNFHSYSGHYGVRLLQQPVLRYLRGLHNRTMSTLVPTQELADELSATGFSDLRVVSRGVDTTLFHPRRRSAALRRMWGVQSDDTPVLMMVSRVAPEKNFPLAIRAFREVEKLLPWARMVIVGDGPQREVLQQANPDIIFAGMQTGMALAEHYASADLFVFSSLSETFGNVTLEAMASGLPVVAYDYAAAREHIVAGQHGLLAPRGNEEEFVRLTVQAATDVPWRLDVGTAAHKLASGLGWERICDDFEQALLDALDECDEYI